MQHKICSAGLITKQQHSGRYGSARRSLLSNGTLEDALCIHTKSEGSLMIYRKHLQFSNLVPFPPFHTRHLSQNVQYTVTSSHASKKYIPSTILLNYIFDYILIM